MVKQYLFTVSVTFAIKGRGLILMPGIQAGPKVHIGDTVELRRPDGTLFTSTIRGIEFPPLSWPARAVPILLPATVVKDDVPIGTEVWLNPSAS